MTTLTIATLFPLATVAAGDEANGAALVRRAAQRGFDATLTTVNRPEGMVTAQIYLLGGDGLVGVADLVAHVRATNVVKEVQSGQAILFAVDAGVATVGRSWTDQAGASHPGLDLVGSTARSTSPSAETVMTRPAPGLSLPAMLGWRSRGFDLTRDPGVGHLAVLLARDPARAPEFDGVVAPGVIGTQLHGPVLALNPELADVVLARALGVAAWDPLPIPSVETARARRIAELASQPTPTPRRGRIRALLPR